MNVIVISEERFIEIVRHEIQSAISTLQINSGTPTDKWFSLEELCDYLPGKPKKPTVYKWVAERQVPHTKQGKRLAFKKSIIDEWLSEKGRKTVSEIQAGATDSLKQKRKRLF